MRQEYKQFETRDSEVLVVTPEDLATVRLFWEEQEMPFLGLSDPYHTVSSLYGQEVSLLKLGRMPAMFVVDKDGRMRYRHFAMSMADIPSTESVLAALDILDGEEEQRSAETSGLRGNSPLP